MRLLFSATMPLKVVLFVTPIIERVPDEPELTVMLFVCVPAKEEVSVALLLPPASPSTMAPAPNAEALVDPLTVPLRIVRLPAKVFAPERVMSPVPELFTMTPAPTVEEIMPEMVEFRVEVLLMVRPPVSPMVRFEEIVSPALPVRKLIAVPADPVEEFMVMKLPLMV